MNTPSLDTLLEKLANGESEAAERVFRDYEPFLRAMVRRRLTPMLRAKFDSMDVVQSVWADVLQGYREAGWQFTDQAHLKSFLARVTYNHFANLCRRNRAALEHEHALREDEWPAEPAADQPRPSQVAQADELWTTLMDLCPPAHREILRAQGTRGPAGGDRRADRVSRVERAPHPLRPGQEAGRHARALGDELSCERRGHRDVDRHAGFAEGRARTRRIDGQAGRPAPIPPAQTRRSKSTRWWPRGAGASVPAPRTYWHATPSSAMTRRSG